MTSQHLNIERFTVWAPQGSEERPLHHTLWADAEEELNEKLPLEHVGGVRVGLRVDGEHDTVLLDEHLSSPLRVLEEAIGRLQRVQAVPRETSPMRRGASARDMAVEAAARTRTAMPTEGPQRRSDTANRTDPPATRDAGGSVDVRASPGQLLDPKNRGRTGQALPDLSRHMLGLQRRGRGRGCAVEQPTCKSRPPRLVSMSRRLTV